MGEELMRYTLPRARWRRQPLIAGIGSRGYSAFACLGRAPRKWGEVPVVLARRIVPVDAKGMHVAVRGFCESKTGRGRVPDVVQIDRLALARARDAFDGDVEHA